MKKEIEEILDDTLRSFDEIEDIPEAADKLISLFEKKIEESMEEISDYLEMGYMNTSQGKAFHIINIIKKGINNE